MFKFVGILRVKYLAREKIGTDIGCFGNGICRLVRSRFPVFHNCFSCAHDLIRFVPTKEVLHGGDDCANDRPAGNFLIVQR